MCCAREHHVHSNRFVQLRRKHAILIDLVEKNMFAEIGTLGCGLAVPKMYPAPLNGARSLGATRA